MESEVNEEKKRQRILHPELCKGAVDTEYSQSGLSPPPQKKNHYPRKRYYLITDLLQRISYNDVYSLGKTY